MKSNARTVTGYKFVFSLQIASILKTFTVIRLSMIIYIKLINKHFPQQTCLSPLTCHTPGTSSFALCTFTSTLYLNCIFNPLTEAADICQNLFWSLHFPFLSFSVVRTIARKLYNNFAFLSGILRIAFQGWMQSPFIERHVFSFIHKTNVIKKNVKRVGIYNTKILKWSRHCNC